MDFFNEFNNCRLQFALNVLSHAKVNELTEANYEELAQLSYLDMLNDAQTSSSYKKYNAVENINDLVHALPKVLKRLPIKSEGNGIFTLSPKEQAALQPFRPLFSSIEKQFLADICRCSEAKLFLQPETIAALSKLPSEPQPIIRTNSVGKESLYTALDADIFRTILEAISTRHYLRYSFRTKDCSAEIETEGIPFKIEYDVYEGRWWLLLYYTKEQRPIKAILQNITKAVISDKKADLTEEDIKQAILSKLTAPERVVLHVENQKNALERTFLIFNNTINRKTKALSDTTCEISFNYFSNDPIINKLLFLGSCVTIVKPASLRQEMIKTLRNILAKEERQ